MYKILTNLLFIYYFFSFIIEDLLTTNGEVHPKENLENP